ncbi:hypothetical protein GCM10007036_41170 [Alsobacter metallidurans]|uniref:DUF934 domain-containing protein n=1 Tax=Alsobacter metallidurans TaxID=340221 RepID=A0A917MLK4_9HYPH|nr:DUF934 domain-containing protein [Alsobacter metallidurans]GGH30517.1 hypothetical protein GCM10007036_41170 [Alsobacter metallidurans]
MADLQTVFRDGAFVADAWATLPADAPAPDGDAPILVGKARFLAERTSLLGRNGPLGLLLEAGEDLDGVEQDLGRFALVALRFPKYTDGRAYSTASLLRSRHAYAGEIRAVGDVLRDQIPFMIRCGVDSFVVTHEPTRRALAEGKVHGVLVAYQAAVADEAAPDPKRPWLRVAAG